MLCQTCGKITNDLHSHTITIGVQSAKFMVCGVCLVIAKIQEKEIKVYSDRRF